MAEGGVAQQERQSGGGNRYKAILSNRSVNLLATFALIYTGTEVTLGGALCSFSFCSALGPGCLSRELC